MMSYGEHIFRLLFSSHSRLINLFDQISIIEIGKRKHEQNSIALSLARSALFPFVAGLWWWCLEIKEKHEIPKLKQLTHWLGAAPVRKAADKTSLKPRRDDDDVAAAKKCDFQYDSTAFSHLIKLETKIKRIRKWEFAFKSRMQKGLECDVVVLYKIFKAS